MHAANGITRPTQPTCSLVASLGGSRNRFYTTAAANPCMSPFFPVFADGAEMPSGYRPGAATFDEASFWWSSEKRHRRAVLAFGSALDAIRSGRGYEGMVEKVEAGAGTLDQDTVDGYFDEARRITREWGDSLGKSAGPGAGWLLRRYWEKYNRLNGLS
jgi:hypothetical protein